MEERRQYPRRRVFKGASIAFDSGVVTATVRNMSATGAAIEIPIDNAQVPHEFTLMIEADSFLGRCHVVWRHEKRIGVAFGSSGELNAAAN